MSSTGCCSWVCRATRSSAASPSCSRNGGGPSSVRPTASGGSNLGFQYDLDNPLESLAEGVLVSVRDAMDSMFFQTDMLAEMIDSYTADGVVYHPIKSCRTVSTGLADNRRALMEATNIPSLFIESDLMDRRVVSEAQLKNRVDAFFEGLATRKRQAAINP